MATDVVGPVVDRFSEALTPILVDLDGDDRRADRLRRDVVTEAAAIVAAVIDADGLHSDDELWGYIAAFGPRVDTSLAMATPDDARRARLVEGKRTWLTRPSAMFELLVEADRRRGTTSAWTYYQLAMELAHTTQSLDTHVAAGELETVEGFRSVLLHAIDAGGVRPGRARAGTAAEEDGARDDVRPELPPARPLEAVLADLDRLIGLEPVKHEVRLVTNLLQVSRLRRERGLPTLAGSRHLVFTGNPGTGKTTVARLLAEIYRALGVVERGHLVETDRSGLVAGYVGQTASKVVAVFDEADGGLLLIDEAYSLVRGSETDFGREAIDTVVKLVEDRRDRLVVILAGYPAEMELLVGANPGMRSRFPKTIFFPDYTDEELLAIFATMVEANHYRLAAGVEEAVRAYLAGVPRGHGYGNARVVRNLLEAAVANHASRVVDITEPSDADLVTLLPPDIPERAPHAD